MHIFFYLKGKMRKYDEKMRHMDYYARFLFKTLKMALKTFALLENVFLYSFQIFI